MSTNLAPNLVERDDELLIIKNVILSYEHCHEPWAKNPGETKKYSATGLIDPKTHKKEIAILQDRLTAIQKEVFKSRLPADKLCLRDGTLTGKDNYEGKWYLATSEKTKPLLLSRDGKTVITEADDKIYSGAVVNIMFKFWTQNNQYGKRINANLVGVQFMDHGEKFSNVYRPAVDEAFDDEGGDDGDDGFDD